MTYAKRTVAPLTPTFAGPSVGGPALSPLRGEGDAQWPLGLSSHSPRPMTGGISTARRLRKAKGPSASPSPLNGERAGVRGATVRLIFMLYGLIAGSLSFAASAAELAVKIVPRFNGEPLEFSSIPTRTAAGQGISVTRIDRLLSKFALRST